MSLWTRKTVEKPFGIKEHPGYPEATLGNIYFGVFKSPLFLLPYCIDADITITIHYHSLPFITIHPSRLFQWHPFPQTTENMFSILS